MAGGDDGGELAGGIEGPRSGCSSISSMATKAIARNTAAAMNTQRNAPRESASPRPAVDPAQHDGAEHRDHDGAAELAEERERAGGDAELVRRHRVLDDQRRGRIHRPDAGAGEREQRRDRQQRQPIRPDRERRTAAIPSGSPMIDTRL